MDELCESLSELDMESKFFEYVPYNSDDPDFTWYQHVRDSNEDNCPRPQSSSSLSNEKDSNHNRKRQRKRQKTKKRHQELEIPQLEDYSSKVKSSITSHCKGFNRRDNCEDKSTSDSDSDISSKEFIKRHRRSAFAHSMKDEEAEFKDKYSTNSYPSNTETVKTVPSSTIPISTTETEPNFIIPSHISPRKPQHLSHQERSKYDYGRHSLPFTNYGARSPSEGESFNYAFRSPQKKFKNSPKFNRFTSEVMPCYKNYQLLGDSQLLRFSEQLLNCKRFVTFTEDTSSRRLGYCVSGQKIKDLEQRILRNELKISSKLIILIGTNDMVYGTELKSMCDSFDSMLKKLKRDAERIVILTVPPAPKLVNDITHINKLQQFNLFLRNCSDDTKVFLVDLASLYLSYSNTISNQYFEPILYKNNTNSKADLVHLNRNGFKLLKAILDIEYFDKFISSEL